MQTFIWGAIFGNSFDSFDIALFHDISLAMSNWIDVLKVYNEFTDLEKEQLQNELCDLYLGSLFSDVLIIIS